MSHPDHLAAAHPPSDFSAAGSGGIPHCRVGKSILAPRRTSSLSSSSRFTCHPSSWAFYRSNCFQATLPPAASSRSGRWGTYLGLSSRQLHLAHLAKHGQPTEGPRRGPCDGGAVSHPLLSRWWCGQCPVAIRPIHSHRPPCPSSLLALVQSASRRRWVVVRVRPLTSPF